MNQVTQSIDVNVPLQAVYNQWTQFEEFPRFMEGVREVRQLDDTHLHWRADRHGHEVEWDSEIVEQVPDQLIAWRDVDGPGNEGRLRFAPLAEGSTRIELEMGLASRDSDSDDARHADEMRQRLQQDLMRFKQLLEAQGQASGAWRGEVHAGRPQPPSSSPPFEV